MNKILELKNISKTYKTFSFFKSTKPNKVLKDISFSLHEKEALALLGQSGSGKSTIAKIICNITKQDNGEIYLEDKKVNLKTLSQKREFYKKVQIVFQDSISALNPALNIFEAISEPLDYLSKFTKNEKKKIVTNLLKKVHLDISLDTKVSFLSGGMAQRVCIARAMAISPKIIILDEATSSLDIILQKEIINLINEMKRKFSFIIITHDMRIVKMMCDRVILLDDGKIIENLELNNKQTFQSNIGRKLISSILPRKPTQFY